MTLAVALAALLGHRWLRVALNNAFGFGGHNTCAVFTPWPRAA